MRNASHKEQAGLKSASQHPELIPGTPIKLQGREFIVPALSFGQIKRLAKKLETVEKNHLEGKFGLADMETVAEVIGEAIGRNYDGVKKEDLFECLDLNNAPAIMRAIKGESGLVVDKPSDQAADKAGE